jgi:ADP-ribosylglycohydrolase
MGRLVRIATRVTHTDPKAEHGALAIALAAHIAAREEEVRGDAYVAKLESLLGEAGRETMELLRRAAASAQMGESTDAFARALGLETGVTGYMLHTVPVCIHAWLASPRDYRAAVTAMVACGGDTDTTAAIVGGIVGSAVGKEGIPAPWLEGLLEWPRSARWIEDLGTILGQSSRQHAPSPPPRAFGPWILARNAAFTLVVLAHVARRCLPPY